jgi:hypothetical protein
MPGTHRTPSDVRRTAIAAPYEDGLLELLMALLFVGIAAVWGVGRGEVLGLLALPIIIGGGLALAWIKRTVTEPRIGHVEPRKDDGPAWHWFAFIGAGLLLMAIAVILTGEIGTSESWMRWFPFLSGYLIAGAFRYLAAASGLRRYLVLGAASLICGTTVAIASDGSSYASVAAYFMAMAIIVAAFGGTALVLFLSRHPRLESLSIDTDGDKAR